MISLVTTVLNFFWGVQLNPRLCRARPETDRMEGEGGCSILPRSGIFPCCNVLAGPSPFAPHFHIRSNPPEAHRLPTIQFVGFITLLPLRTSPSFLQSLGPDNSDHQPLHRRLQLPDLVRQLTLIVCRDACSDNRPGHSTRAPQRRHAGNVDVGDIFVLGHERERGVEGRGHHVGGEDHDFRCAAVERLDRFIGSSL